MYILGLDIGIASVGYAVVEKETNKIITAGVRLFDSADASKNQERRGFRGTKRNQRRKRHRLDRLNIFLEENSFTKPIEINLSPIELRIKGLSEKLTKEELYVSLYNIAKHRGVSYLEDLEEVKDNNKILEILDKNKDKYPCQIQYEKFKNFGFYRGTKLVEDELLINTFPIGLYEKESRAILDKQKEFYNEITDEFIEKYIEILKSKREYYIGPGNELSRTNYGVYKTNGETKKNLFDELRGKCSVYNGKNGMDEELRASGASYTAQYYNLLNDLCNIEVGGEKLTKEQKEEVITFIKSSKTATKITVALKKLYKISPELVTGYRIDKKDNEENHSFQTYRLMRKFLEEREIDINKFSIDTLDEIADILTLNTETKGMLDSFGDKVVYKHISDLTTKEIEAFIDFRRKNTSEFNRWNSFSYKLIKEIIPEMLETGDEQNTCINRMGIRNNQTEVNKLDYKSITDEIYNPVVKRAIIQTVKIIELLEKEYKFSEVVIEMAREKNSDEQRKNKKDMQKNNEELLAKAIKFAGIDEEKLDFRNHKNLPLKLKLFYKQQGKCLYSGKSIDINKLIKNEKDYEIDHIIPISISFDDSQSNKVLVETGENAKKSNNTPYRYFNNKSDSSWNYGKYKEYVLDLHKKGFINKKHKEMLLFEEDITKQKVVQGFINRNINDTRYASKVVLNELQRYYSPKDTKVKVINGSMTNQFRKNILKFDKDRDLDYSHHAIDAIICCYTTISLKNKMDKYINIETGEVLNKVELNNLSKSEKAPYLPQSGLALRFKIDGFMDKIKYSHKVDTKVNRSVSDQTIYSTRKTEDGEYVVNKIKDIYNDDEFKKLKEKIDKDEEKFLMYKHDPKTWEMLKKVIEQYSDHKNPFRAYKEEHGPFRKYSKKGNGPEIKMIKYMDKKVGSKIDITHKYNAKNKRVILSSLKPFRSDVYYDNNKKCYNIVPIKYSDFKFDKGKYILSIDRYEELLKAEGILDKKQNIDNLKENSQEFCFSLYKNSIIELGNDKEINKYRFLAKNHSSKNRFEVKEINKTLNKQKHITLKKDFNICNKYHVDILGNMYKIQKEKLKLEFKLDNDKIK